MTTTYDQTIIDDGMKMFMTGSLEDALAHPALEHMKRKHEEYQRKHGLGVFAKQKVAIEMPEAGREATPMHVSEVTAELEVNIDNAETIIARNLKTSMSSKRIILPTGGGKTTRLPQVFKKCLNKAVLVVEPSIFLAESAYSYVYRAIDSTVGLYVDPGGPMPKNAIVYAAAPAIVLRYMSDEYCLSGFGIVLLDEAHEMTAHYEALKALLLMAGNVYVYYMSATFGRSVAHQRKGPGIQKKVIGAITYGSTDIPDDSPLNWRMIRGRTMLIMPDDFHHQSYQRYYESHGIWCDTLTVHDGAKKLDALNVKLETDFEGLACVIIADTFVEYGVTVIVDVGIDFALKVTYNIDPKNRQMLRDYRKLTRDEIEQREGRLGRVMNGTYMIMQEHPVRVTVDRYAKFFSYLWLVVIGIKPTVEYDKVGMLLAYPSRQKAWAMLRTGLHPYIVRDMFLDHRVYDNLARGLQLFGQVQNANTVLDFVRSQWFDHGGYFSPLSRDSFCDDILCVIYACARAYKPRVRSLTVPAPTVQPLRVLEVGTDSEAGFSDAEVLSDRSSVAGELYTYEMPRPQRSKSRGTRRQSTVPAAITRARELSSLVSSSDQSVVSPSAVSQLNSQMATVVSSVADLQRTLRKQRSGNLEKRVPDRALNMVKEETVKHGDSSAGALVKTPRLLKSSPYVQLKGKRSFEDPYLLAADNTQNPVYLQGYVKYDYTTVLNAADRCFIVPHRASDIGLFMAASISDKKLVEDFIGNRLGGLALATVIDSYCRVWNATLQPIVATGVDRKRICGFYYYFGSGAKKLSALAQAFDLIRVKSGYVYRVVPLDM